MLATPHRLSRRDLDMLVGGMPLPVIVVAGARVLYMNAAARKFEARLRQEHATDLVVLLVSHVDGLGPLVSRKDTTTLLKAPRGEHFALHVRALGPRTRGRIAIVVREVGSNIDAFSRRYGLSTREQDVVRLLLRGCSNNEMSLALDIRPATVKRHLLSVFEKTGVHSRTRLVCQLV